MTWILRGVGTFLLLFGVGGGALRMLTSRVQNFNDVYAYSIPIVAALALGLLCFAAASALASVRRTEARIARATARRRIQPQVKDLAPVAPKWDEPIPPPRVEVTPGYRPRRRFERENRG